ncbi:hypothetical protein [Staphylococcus pseudintermedius]|uniref:hypothetical protein n=1 Tax=Staphylococcus pseudintermedius TaxID=283734 RepID=UPI0018F4E72C|nr:hypothetical protein [Staphylococcus pseudintermedius]MBJ8312947.1 hypothetical protein [Staphylococcus pseudintermedius]
MRCKSVKTFYSKSIQMSNWTFTVLSLVASFVSSVVAGVIANYISKKIDESDK